MFAWKDSKSSLGHQMLQTFFGRGETAGIAIGVRVVFPKSFGLGTKSFTYSVYGKEMAISAALNYRDNILREKVTSLK